MSYGQPSSSTNEEYGMLSYPLVAKMSYQVLYQMEGGFGINTWVNFEYPIYPCRGSGQDSRDICMAC